MVGQREAPPLAGLHLHLSHQAGYSLVRHAVEAARPAGRPARPVQPLLAGQADPGRGPAEVLEGVGVTAARVAQQPATRSATQKATIVGHLGTRQSSEHCICIVILRTNWNTGKKMPTSTNKAAMVLAK